MIDFDAIGKRILEQRKYLRGLSQERMAEDLGMYQADISNLEKAKRGSGITDLEKLDRIADYFDLPLEALLFGRGPAGMEKYPGPGLQLRESTGQPSRKHTALLRRLLGLADDDAAEAILGEVLAFECGPCSIYAAREHQLMLTGAGLSGGEAPPQLLRTHLYAIFRDEVVGNLTAAVTSLRQYVEPAERVTLKLLFGPDGFDPEDALQVLNPYWLLLQTAADEEEEAALAEKAEARMARLLEAGGRTLCRVESAYVREDCRRHGLFRMMMDALRTLHEGPLLWLNLEPTSGTELRSPAAYHAVYEASGLGQLQINAAIAERLGFTVDSRTVERQAQRIGEDGAVAVETVPVRTTAYCLPKVFRRLLREDRDLLAYARARQRIAGDGPEVPEVLDIYPGAWKKQGFIVSIRLEDRGETVYAFARGMDWASRWLGVSRENPSPTGDFVETLEKYDTLRYAEGSRYYPGLRIAEQLLGSIYFGTVDPKDVRFDEWL